MQFKYTFKPDRKNQFNFLGIATIDDFTLNKDINKLQKPTYVPVGNLLDL